MREKKNDHVTVSKPRVRFIGRHLMVKGSFAESIITGTKRATIRLGIVKPKYNEVIIHSGGRPIAKAKITKVTVKKVRELTDEDALMDGLKTRTELLEVLGDMYDTRLEPDDLVTIIEFVVTKIIGEGGSGHPYRGLEPGDLARLALRYLSNELDEKQIMILRDLTRTNSIRRSAMRLYGDATNRREIRRTLRLVLNILEKKGIIQAQDEEKHA